MTLTSPLLSGHVLHPHQIEELRRHRLYPDQTWQNSSGALIFIGPLLLTMTDQAEVIGVIIKRMEPMLPLTDHARTKGRRIRWHRFVTRSMAHLNRIGYVIGDRKHWSLTALGMEIQSTLLRLGTKSTETDSSRQITSENKIDRSRRKIITRENIDSLLDSHQIATKKTGRWWPVHRNGETQRWKRDAMRIRIPIKYGYRYCAAITEADFPDGELDSTAFRIKPKSRPNRRRINLPNTSVIGDIFTD